MTEADAYRESFGPTLHGAHRSQHLMAHGIARDIDHDGAFEGYVGPVYPDDEINADAVVVSARAIKASFRASRRWNLTAARSLLAALRKSLTLQ